MSNFYLCLLLAGLCVLAHCHHEPGHQGGHDGHEEHQQTDQPPAESHQESGHLACLKIAPSNAEFAFKFYRQIVPKAAGKNIFFSPISISTAFMLLSLIAKGTTVDQIFSGIGFNTSVISEEKIDAGFRHLLQMVNRPKAHFELSIGNALFSDDRFTVKQSIVEEARDLLQADIVPSNFQNTEETKNRINSYVEKNTNGKLKNVSKEISPDAVMVLVNYIWLKGYWEKPFSPEMTRKKDFFVNNETTVQVDMMCRDGYYYTYHDEELGCEVVRVPYQGNASALFILPEEGKLQHVEQGIDRETLLKWEKSATEQRIELIMPTVSMKTSYDVKEIMIEMGVNKIFTDEAELSAFTEQQRLKVSKVVHEGYLNIHENGTEAAATTVMEIVPMSLPPEVAFNRPFLFLIVDHSTHSIPFMGRVVNPNEH